MLASTASNCPGEGLLVDVASGAPRAGEPAYACGRRVSWLNCVLSSQSERTRERTWRFRQATKGLSGRAGSGGGGDICTRPACEKMMAQAVQSHTIKRVIARAHRGRSSHPRRPCERLQWPSRGGVVRAGLRGGSGGRRRGERRHGQQPGWWGRCSRPRAVSPCCCGTSEPRIAVEFNRVDPQWLQ